MQAMALTSHDSLLRLQERDDPLPRDGEIRVRVSACGICRTDLHVIDAELPDIKYPIVPGHEIVGRVDVVGSNVKTRRIGDRVGIPWLGYTCGICRFCKEGMENLCDRPLFTGYTRDGGFATHTIADARYAFPLGELGDDVSIAPLLCAGLIGWRSLAMAGNAEWLGTYAFGAAGHIIAQVAGWQGRSVYAFTRSDDIAAQDFARRVGAVWTGAPTNCLKLLSTPRSSEEQHERPDRGTRDDQDSQRDRAGHPGTGYQPRYYAARIRRNNRPIRFGQIITAVPPGIARPAHFRRSLDRWAIDNPHDGGRTS